MKKNSNPQPIVTHLPDQADLDRILEQLRSIHLANLAAEPGSGDWPPQIHLAQATYQLGKLAEATLGDSRSQIRYWASKLGATSVSLMAHLDRDEEE